MASIESIEGIDKINNRLYRVTGGLRQVGANIDDVSSATFIMENGGGLQFVGGCDTTFTDIRFHFSQGCYAYSHNTSLFTGGADNTTKFIRCKVTYDVGGDRIELRLGGNQGLDNQAHITLEDSRFTFDSTNHCFTRLFNKNAIIKNCILDYYLTGSSLGGAQIDASVEFNTPPEISILGNRGLEVSYTNVASNGLVTLNKLSIASRTVNVFKAITSDQGHKLIINDPVGTIVSGARAGDLNYQAARIEGRRTYSTLIDVPNGRVVTGKIFSNNGGTADHDFTVNAGATYTELLQAYTVAFNTNTAVHTGYYSARFRAYGLTFNQEDINLQWDDDTNNIPDGYSSKLTFAVNGYVSLTEAEAGALTGLAVQKSPLKVTCTDYHSLDEIHDYVHYWLTRPENFDVLEEMKPSGATLGYGQFIFAVGEGGHFHSGEKFQSMDISEVGADFSGLMHLHDVILTAGIYTNIPKDISGSLDLRNGNMRFVISATGRYDITSAITMDPAGVNRVVLEVNVAGVTIATPDETKFSIATESTHSPVFLKIAPTLKVTGSKSTDTVILARDRDGTDLFTEYQTPIQGGGTITFQSITYSGDTFSAWLIVSSAGGGRIEFPVGMQGTQLEVNNNLLAEGIDTYDIATNTAIGIVAVQVEEIKKKTDRFQFDANNKVASQPITQAEFNALILATNNKIDALDIPTVSEIWSHSTRSVIFTAEQLSAIGGAVEAAIINEEDGKAVIDAIVKQIGNENIVQAVLVGAIRSDMEREGGLIDTIKKKTDGLTYTSEGDLVTQATAIVQSEFNTFMQNLPDSIKETFKGGSSVINEAERKKIVDEFLNVNYGTLTDGSILKAGSLGEHLWFFNPDEIVRRLLTQVLNGIVNPTRFQPLPGVYGEGTFGDAIRKIVDNNTKIADANSTLAELKTLLNNQGAAGLTPEQAAVLESIKATVEAIPHVDEQEITSRLETLLTELRAVLPTVTPETPPDNTAGGSVTFIQGDTGNVAFSTSITSIEGDLFFSVGIDVGDLIHEVFEVPASFTGTDTGGTITATIPAEKTARLRFGTDYKFEISNTKTDGTKARVSFGDVIIKKSVA